MLLDYYGDPSSVPFHNQGAVWLCCSTLADLTEGGNGDDNEAVIAKYVSLKLSHMDLLKSLHMV